MNNPLSGPNGVWWKIVAIAVPLGLGAIVASVRTSTKVDALAAEMDKKADQNVMTAYQQAILRELNQIQEKIDDIVDKQRRP